ncbi:MAG: DUF4148 domain-containing protein [Pseudomonadota bacterium]|nr:DUF4148 domain-containing protein [Pseudomonadota bacterium]
MNKLNALILASLSIFAATSASAAPNSSSLTRAEVQSEYARARAAGEVNNTGYDTVYDHRSPAASQLTRAEVQAEYLRAKAAGDLLTVAGYASAADVATSSTLTRAEVFKEYQRARESGELAALSNAFGSSPARRVMQ